MSDEAPKSALEIALERLKKKDQEAGLPDRKVTPEERERIAETRRMYEAKMAESEILHQASRRKAMDPEALEALEAEYLKGRERLAAERDRKIEEIRRGAQESAKPLK